MMMMVMMVLMMMMVMMIMIMIMMIRMMMQGERGTYPRTDKIPRKHKNQWLDVKKIRFQENVVSGYCWGSA